VAFSRPSALLVALSVVTGCGARGLSSRQIGYDWRDSVETEAKPKRRPPRKDVAPDAVENSALPFHGLRARDCQPLSGDELMTELAGYDAICIG
jgi:hypothetical protein